jgi:hypothetical protein
MGFTHTWGPSSSASERVSATTAAVDAQYRSWPGDGTKASIDARLTTAAPSTSDGATACVTSRVPSTLTSKVRR